MNEQPVGARPAPSSDIPEHWPRRPCSAASAHDDHPAERGAVDLEAVATSCPDEGGGREETVVGISGKALIHAGRPIQLTEVLAVSVGESNRAAPVDPRGS